MTLRLHIICRQIYILNIVHMYLYLFIYLNVFLFFYFCIFLHTLKSSMCHSSLLIYSQSCNDACQFLANNHADLLGSFAILLDINIYILQSTGKCHSGIL